MSTPLDSYLVLEQAMVALDSLDDEGHADLLRDILTPLWEKLTDGERAALNARPDSKTSLADQHLHRVREALQKMWEGRYAIDTDSICYDVEMGGDPEDPFHCPVAVDLGDLAVATTEFRSYLQKGRHR